MSEVHQLKKKKLKYILGTTSVRIGRNYVNWNVSVSTYFLRGHVIVTGKYIFDLKMFKYLPTHTTGQKIIVQSNKMTRNNKEIKSLSRNDVFNFIVSIITSSNVFKIFLFIPISDVFPLMFVVVCKSIFNICLPMFA